MKKSKLIILAMLLAITMTVVGCSTSSSVSDKTDLGNASVDNNNDTVSISRDDDSSNFYDFRDGLKEALEIDVEIMLDEYDINEGEMKVNQLAGVMLSALLGETHNWQVDIEKEEVLEFTSQGREKNIVGERQGFDFFAFKGLKQGTTNITIKAISKESGEAESTYTFEMTVTK